MTSIGIGIGIGDTGPVFTWYQIDTKICSIAHPYILLLPLSLSVFACDVHTSRQWPVI